MPAVRIAKPPHHFGWVPDFPDHRDYLYAAPVEVMAKMAAKIDLRKACPACYDQGQLGSYTANAIAGAVEFELMKQHKAKKSVTTFTPSRLFIYYNERAIEGTVNQDSGAQIRDGIKSVNKQGCCPESMWPYDIPEFTVAPPAACYKAALKDRAILYHRLVQALNQMKGCLASGYPFVFGFTVYESFESPQVAQTGVVPMPEASEQVLGGHAVLAVGYDDAQRQFIVRNSWGTGWGVKGYCFMPYAYLTDDNLASDFWTIRMVD
jgi:C1A family cysteine protease